MNDTDHYITFYDKSSDFTSEIVEQVRCGFGFTPFVGSGISASSGILMGQTFTNFLAHTMYQVLDKQRNLRTDGWPAQPTEAEIEKARKFIEKEYAAHLKRVGLKLRKNDKQKISGFAYAGESAATVRPPDMLRPLIPEILPKTEEARQADLQLKEQCRVSSLTEHLYVPLSSTYSSPGSAEFVSEAGIRSLNDWRATLEFFARVDVKNNRIFYTDRDPSVIDGFNSHIIRDVQPTLGHKMLAHLSHRLRMRTLLTTNFDPLIEKAFDQLSFPLEVLEVHSPGQLPDPATVRAQNCLIKLHGGLFETRADLTLDESPDDEELKRFVQILRGRKSRPIVPTHLLVLGFSASDLRIIQFLKHALNKTEDLKMFWICFNEGDKEHLKRVFFERDYEGRINVFQTLRPDLLLYELYQEAALCLPGGGFSYEFTHKVPPLRTESGGTVGSPDEVDRMMNWLQSAASSAGVPEPYTLEDENGNTNCQVRLSNVEPIDSQQTPEPPPELPKGVRKPEPLSDPTGKLFVAEFLTGAADMMQPLFDRYRQRGKDCIWLELQDYPSVGYLADEVFRIIALRRGKHQSQHIAYTRLLGLRDEHNESHVRYWKLLLKHLGVKGEDWVLFLYGRNVPGSCAGWFDKAWENGKADSDTYRELQRLLRVLAHCGFTIIYLPFTQSRQEREVEKSRWLEDYVGDDSLRDLRVFGFREPGADERDAAGLKEEFKESLAARTRLPATIDHIDNINLPESDQLQSPRERRKTYEDFMTRVMTQFIPNPSELPVEKADPNASEMRRLRFQFVYASSLFRHSRHVSAFFSEATFRCPFQFNIETKDNDVFRAGYVAKWLEKLRSFGIFFYKPGGYSWKHRDIRLGLQQMIEELPPLQFETTPMKLDHAGQLRCRSHFWIADWYMKAFMATGHGMPLLEAIYHFLSSALTAPFAKPIHKEFNSAVADRYRLWRFIAAVNEAAKSMRLGIRWLRMWMLLEDEADPLFNEDVRKDVENRLFAAHAKITFGMPRSADEPKYLIDLFRRMESVETSLRRNHSLREPLRIEGRNYGEDFDEDERLDVAYFGRDDDWNDWTDVLTKTAKKRGDKKPSPLWHAIRNILEKPFETDGETNPPSEASHTIRNALIDIEHKLITDKNEVEIELVSYLAEYAYLHLQRAKLQTLCVPEKESHRGQKDKERLEEDESRREQEMQVRLRWRQVNIICYLGLSLCRQLRSEELEAELFVRIKLNSIYAIALGHLGRYFEAHRHLNEATALLSKTREGLNDLEVAIIRLRRAEVFLCEAEALEQVALKEDTLRPEAHPLIPNRESTTTELPYEVFVRRPGKNRAEKRECEEIENPDNGHEDERVDGPEKQARKHREEERQKADEKKRTKEHEDWERLFYATMDDAAVNLESAQKLLSGRSHSSLWWARYLTLVMRAISLIPVEKKSEGEQPPADARHEDSKNGRLPKFDFLLFRRRQQKDEMLRAAFRQGLLLSADDEYRLARILLSYCKAASRLFDLESAGQNDADPTELNIVNNHDWELIDEKMCELHSKGSFKQSKLLSEFFERVKEAVVDLRRKCPPKGS